MTEVCEQCPTPLVIDHHYQPTAWPDTCGYRYTTGWPCGYAEDEHTARLEGAPEEQPPADRDTQG